MRCVDGGVPGSFARKPWAKVEYGWGRLPAPQGQVAKRVDLPVWTLQHPILGIDIGLKRAGVRVTQGCCCAFGEVRMNQKMDSVMVVVFLLQAQHADWVE